MNKTTNRRLAGFALGLFAVGSLLATAAPAQAAPVDVACGNNGGICWITDSAGVGQYELDFAGNTPSEFGNGGWQLEVTDTFSASKGNPVAVKYKSLDGKKYEVKPRIVYPQ